MSEVLCKDCKHSKVNFFDKLIKNAYGYKCTIPEALYQPTPDKALGLSRPAYFESCNVSRADSRICGPDAKNWVPKDTSKVFIFLKRI